MTIGLVGFGEVGAALADDLAPSGATLTAWDIRFGDVESKPSRARSSRQVQAARTGADVVRGATLVISAVTAAQTLAAAETSANALTRGAFYLDLNSASPRAKAAAACAINAAGGRYVEAAVMSPIAPKGIATSMLLGGPHVEAFFPLARELGFTGATFFSSDYGVAAAAKLCRSILVKGIEALLVESMLTARSHGVEDIVLESLDDLFPGHDWRQLSGYMIARVLEHGARRAEEMREAAHMVAESGLAPLLSEAIADRQAWAADLSAALDQRELDAMLDSMRVASSKRDGALT